MDHNLNFSAFTIYLFNVVLVDLKIDPLDFIRGLDFDPAQEGLEKVEHGASTLQESGQPFKIVHISKIDSYPRLDKSHRRCQIFPVSLADFCQEFWYDLYRKIFLKNALFDFLKG